MSSSKKKISRASKILASYREKKSTMQFNSSKNFQIHKNLLDIEKQLEVLKKKKTLRQNKNSSSNQIQYSDKFIQKPKKELSKKRNTQNGMIVEMSSTTLPKKTVKRKKNLTVSSKHLTKPIKMKKNFEKVLDKNLKRFSN